MLRFAWRGFADGAADGVDGAHVVAVTVLDRITGREVDSKRGARQRHLDIVHRKGIAGEQHVHVTEADQLAEVFRPPSVYDNRAGDERDSAATVAGAITVMFVFQVFLNVGMTIGIAPVTGITLPFVSYGGSSMIVSLAFMGLLQAIHVRGRMSGR